MWRHPSSECSCLSVRKPAQTEASLHEALQTVARTGKEVKAGFTLHLFDSLCRLCTYTKHRGSCLETSEGLSLLVLLRLMQIWAR